jgi:signal transduction histidine kinase/integral membrane sensor domain MASE1/CheY-like chemotaxis protein
MTDHRMPQFRPSTILLNLATAALYLVAAKLGLALAFEAQQVTPVWPASGIALAAVILFGPSLWPGIWLGAFIANATSGEPLLTAMAIASGNTLEPLAALWLLRRVGGFQPALVRLRDVLGFAALGAGLAPVIAATIGVVSLCASGLHPWSQSLILWTTWWVGDAIGVLVAAPVLLTARAWWKWRPNPWVLAEAAAGLAAGTIVCTLVFGSRFVSGHGLGSAYSTFPLIIWAAVRFRQPLTSLLLVIVAILADWGTIHGLGPFTLLPLGSRLLPLQIFLGILVITGLFLSAGMAERVRAERIHEAELAITRTLAGSTTLETAAPKIIRAVCATLEWDIGSLWIVTPDKAEMRDVGIWAMPGLSFPGFEAATRNTRMERGRGLPGRVWATGRSAFIADVSRDDNFPRGPVAVSEGIHGAFGFPIILGDETVGVLEFFSREVRSTDTNVLQMFEKIGALLGQFMGRERREIERVALLARESAARMEAENVNRLKDEFLATLSHELRTPLNAVLGWTHLLSEAALDKKGIDRAVETIRRNVRLQDQIISDILDVSRIIAGKIRLDLQDIDLDAALRMVLESLRPTADAKKGTLGARHEAPGLAVRGDARRIEQILWNLISNAIKYVPEGGHVDVSIRAEGPWAEIWVQDDGPGIAPAFLPHIFERFRQADSSSTRSHGGLGLGLAIVRHLVELHGGQVEAHNRTDGPGARFGLRLRTMKAPEKAAVRKIPETTPSTNKIRLDGVHVLIVDNDLDARELLAVILQRSGARVTLADSAIAAMRILGEFLPHAILADIEMPQEDGYSLVRQVRGLSPEQGGGIPVVAVTAYASDSDRAKALSAGFSIHVAKPVHPVEIVSVVDVLTRSAGLRSQRVSSEPGPWRPVPNGTT